MTIDKRLNMRKTMQAGTFKAECLKVMDEVRNKKSQVIITKRNEPVAMLVPIENTKKSLFGCMKGTVKISGDIITAIDEDWDADR